MHLHQSSEHLEEFEPSDVLLVDPELAIVLQLDHCVMQLTEFVAKILATWAAPNRLRRVGVKAIDEVCAEVVPGHIGVLIVSHLAEKFATN